MLRLRPIEDADSLQGLVDDVFADPEVRRGMGWTEADPLEDAMDAIHGLWRRRLASGWQLLEVRDEGERAGLAGLGPVDPEDGSAWYAIYLLHRGEGLGRRVTRRLIRRAREAGARELVAVTWAKNTASQALLEGEGFERVGAAPYDWAEQSELDWLELRCPLDPASAFGDG